MTREEAIEMLKALNMMLRNPDGEPISDVCEAIDMAIEALSAEVKENRPKPDYSYEADMVRRLKESLSEPNGDLISRADAIEAVCDKCPISFKDKCEWKDNRHCSMNVALKALPSAEAKGDLIRREDAIEAVVCHIWHMPNEAYRQFNCENMVREVVEDAINRLPSAEAEQRWIPCSERLPDVGEIVIASWSDLWSDAIVFARRYCEDDWEWAYEQGSDYWESARDYDRESNPEAWMPLPEPYAPKTERRG